MTFCSRPMGNYGGTPQSGAYVGGNWILNSDGSCTGTQYTGPAIWIDPPFAGAGSAYWVQCTKTGGTRTLSPATGTWQSIASGVTYTATGGAGNVTGTVQFSAAADGSNPISGGTFSVNNTL